ncbi:putative amino acid transporter [Neospora caninum Liverpool]|uniref:Amino acid transporter, putative n=1 Tax=Neospora caninum (strain Liverpool) TaxID=572307 RepID=F0VC72_NEOCL|nr:putative amino acid transporter [Neospora caninum Liverpool]CBZ51206.1 putative amino acid transporter [Neospora caninum Liverpool]CEL68520.1 TPA: amino acid transporter, putative [Neospora caninum Liverpool]|eukprot:XP_003881239.1 putative amino acid transporter [Neospora caninum Liverpool]
MPGPSPPALSTWRSRIKGWIPPSDLPGSVQPTPCNFNRYALLFFYVISGCVTGVVFFGWPAMASLIFHNAGFSTLCTRDPDTGDFSPDFRKEGKMFICDAQDAAIQKLYPVAGVLCCIMSACGGALLDFIGPKLTMCLGQTLSLIGWLFLAFSGAAPGSYYAGIALIGLGADVGFLPTMCVTRLFPGSAGLVITLLSSASSASSAVPVVLAKIVEQHGVTLKTVSLWYICCGPVVSIIIAVFLMPRRNYLVGEDGAHSESNKFEKGPAKMCETGDGRSVGAVDGWDAASAGEVSSPRRKPAKAEAGRQLRFLSTHNSLASDQDTTGNSGVEEDRGRSTRVEESCTAAPFPEPSLGTAAQFAGQAEGSRLEKTEECRNRGQETAGRVQNTLFAGERSPTSGEIGLVADAESCEKGEDGGNDVVVSFPGEPAQGNGPQQAIATQGEIHECPKAESKYRCPARASFFGQLFSERYLIVAVYFIGVAGAATFYQQAPRRMFTDPVVDFMEILQPLGFLPCIILGKCADVFGILKILTVVNTFGVLMYATSMVRGFDNALGYTSVVLYTLYMSVFTSQIFVYIEATFSPQYFGKLIGLTAMCGGLFSVVSSSLYEHVVIGVGKGDPRIMQIAMTVFLGFQYLWIARLFWLKKRDPNPYRSGPARLASSDTPSARALPICQAPFEPVCQA